MDPQIKKYVISVIATLAVMLVGLGIAITFRLIQQSKYDEAKSYNNSPTVLMQSAEYDAAVEKRDTMLAKYNSINTVVETIDSYPVCNDDVIATIEETARGYAKIEILSFDAEEGRVTFSAKADDVNDIYKYIDKLLEEDIFMNVDHTGYTYSETDKLYDIHVICTLAESVGRDK